MISLCMIIKNEEETLQQSLESVRGLVDEIIIVDTGSTDNSKKIAHKFTDNVFDYKWNNDFAQARNYALSKVSYDWVLVLDGDEVITNYNKNKIIEFCNKSNKVVGRLEIANIFEDNFGIKKYVERVNRFFYINNFMYEGIIHEQIVSKTREEYTTEKIDISVEHIGYLKNVVNKKDKINRNITLLNKAIKESKSDPYLYYQLGKSYFLGKNYKEAYKNFMRSLELVEVYGYNYVEDLVECYGYCMINLQMYEKAVELYKYKKYYSNSADYMFLMALIEMNNGNFQKAAETFLECTKFKKGKIEGVTTFLPMYNIGVIFQCLGLKDDAIIYFSMCKDYLPAKKRIEEISSDK